MKKVIFYCDLCNKEIKDSDNDPCIAVSMMRTHNWNSLDKARKIFDGCVCETCGNKIESFINNLHGQIIEEV